MSPVLRRAVCLTLAVLLAHAPAPAGADLIHLTDGGTLEGTAREEGGVYVVTLISGGVVKVPKAKVAGIEAKPLQPKPAAKPAEAPGAAPAAPAKALLGESYVDPFQGFRLRIPARWIEGKPMPGASATFTARPPHEGYPPRLAVLVKVSSRPLADDHAEIRKQFAAAFAGTTLSADRSFAAGERAGLAFEADFASQREALHALYASIDAGQVKYYLLFTAPQEAFAALAPSLTACMESFHALPLGAIDQAARDKFKQSLDRGLASYKQGRVDEAIKEFAAAAAAVPTHPLPHQNLAAIYASKKDLDAAIREYQALLALKPDSPSAHFNLASMLSQKQKYEDAIAAYEKAIALDPEYAEAHLNLGALYQLKGKSEAALAAIRRAVELDPRSALGHFNLGQVLLEAGNTVAARAEFEKTLELDPNHKLAQEALANLKGGAAAGS